MLRRLSIGLALLLGSAPLSAAAGNYRSALAHGLEARDRAQETGNPEDWRDALDAFQEAIRLELTKEAKFEFASAAAHLEFNDEACEAYEQALRLGLAGKAAEIADAFVESHRSRLSRLDLTGPTGATVRIGTRPRGSLPFSQPLLVVSGSVLLHLEAPGFRVWERSVTLTPGEIVHQSVSMLPIPPPRSALIVGNSLPLSLPPSPPERGDAPASAWGKPLLGVGAALTSVGVATAIVTSSLLASEQRTLERNCTVLRGDECLKTAADKQASAQGAADHIAAERSVRWAAVGGALLGIGAMSVGLVRILTVDKVSKSTHVNLGVGPASLGFELVSRF